MSEESEEVYLYIYDLSSGIASRLSYSLIGRQVEGIWHTSIVCYGKEYYYGSQGVTVSPPGCVIGEPLRKQLLGHTQVPNQVFEQYLHELNHSEFRGDSYNLFSHNCNNFSNTATQFLVGVEIPQYILDLPNQILNTPLGQTFRGLFESLAFQSPDLSEVYTFDPEGTPSDRRLHSLPNRGLICGGERRMSEESPEIQLEGENGGGAIPAEQLAEQIADDERKEKEEKRKNREPPVVYKDAVDVHIEFDKLVGLIDGKLTEEEQLSLEELHQYMFQDEGSWALGDQFLVFIGRLLTDPSLGEETSVCCMNVLAAAALKDDIILMLHQDRKLHILMNYAQDIDRLPLPQQKALALFICNLFENPSSSEWMLYISEWMKESLSLSNIRVLTKVAVNSLLSEDPELFERGTAIIHNIATKEVFDDVAVEVTMAILQFLGGSPSEPHVFRCLKALVKFAQIAAQDVPQLIQMIGPHPSKFKGQSERNDQLIEQLSKRIR